MGYDQFASNLIGTLRHELSVGDAVRGVLEGILDGYERFRAITDVVTYNREHLRQAAERPLHLILVDPDRWLPRVRNGAPIYRPILAA